MGTEAPLLTYFGEPKQTESVIKALKNDKAKIKITGLTGSSYSIITSSVIRKINQPHLFIFRDKEEASYFTNDIENLLKNDVFFFPESYRRSYQLEETNNSNILLRAEVLSKLNHKRNPIIITYSHALSEKVVSRKELKRHTVNLKKNDRITTEKLELMLDKFCAFTN